MIKEATAVYPPVVENIPEQLTERPQWVCSRYEERDGKQTKVPYTATGHRASATDLMTWTTGAMAYRYYQDGHCDGIGFVFSSADPFCGIDLDDCRDPESGELKGWAKEVMGQFGTEAYTERSPSGRGIHIIVKGSVRGGGMRKDNIEMYSRGRF